MKEIDRLLNEQENPEKGSTEFHLMKSLEKDFDISFSSQFTEKIMMKIRAQERKSQRQFWVILSLGVLTFFALAFVGLFYFIGWEGLTGMKNIAIYGVLIGLLVVFIQYLDHLLLPRMKLA